MTFKVHLFIACDVFRGLIAFKFVLLQVMSLQNPEFQHQMSKFHVLMTVVCTVVLCYVGFLQITRSVFY